MGDRRRLDKHMGRSSSDTNRVVYASCSPTDLEGTVRQLRRGHCKRFINAGGLRAIDDERFHPCSLKMTELTNSM